jgi:AraC-like DNA-binding protein
MMRSVRYSFARKISIAHIADAVGYGTFANFNRQFKLLTSMTPREYRAHFRPKSENRN